MKSNLSYSPETLKSGQNWWFFCPAWPWNLTLTVTLKNNRTSLLYYIKLCASFQSHWWIQTGVTVRQRPIWVKIDDFQSHAALKFDGWPWKTIGHIFYATSSFVQHFVTIGEFKLELQSGNALGQIQRFLAPCDIEIWRMTLKTTGHLLYATSSFMQHFVAIGEFKLELQSGNAISGSNSTIFFEPCDLEILRMTLINNRAPLLCYFKLCASFRTHWWIKLELQSGNDQFGSNSTIFIAVRPWNLTDDLEKQ